MYFVKTDPSCLFFSFSWALVFFWSLHEKTHSTELRLYKWGLSQISCRLCYSKKALSQLASKLSAVWMVIVRCMFCVWVFFLSDSNSTLERWTNLWDYMEKEGCVNMAWCIDDTVLAGKIVAMNIYKVVHINLFIYIYDKHLIVCMMYRFKDTFLVLFIGLVK